MRADPSNLPAGTALGGYRIDALLGRGSFGAVYRATSTSSGAEVAVKVLAGRHDADAHASTRFRREAELAARLRHPNSVRVLDVGAALGKPFIVFELLRGEPLDAALERDGRIPTPRAVRITIEILSALEEAHAIGLVHRDLKPANVFLVAEPGGGQRVKVVDFGLAKSTNPGTLAGLTGDGTAVGTPLYMSPEQIAGDTVGPPSDLFAVGLVLAEMIHGASIFPDVPAMVLLTQRLAGEPLLLPTNTPVGAIIERATRLDPKARWASASEMKRALGAASSQITESGALASAPTHPISGRRPGRSRWVVALGAAAAILAGAILVTVLVRRAQREGAATPATETGSARQAVTSTPTTPPRTPPVASASTPRALLAEPPAVDNLVDPTALLATVRRRFGDERVVSIRVERTTAFVTIEERGAPTSEELYVVQGEVARPHGKTQGRHQPRPIDLSSPLLARLPALVVDAQKRTPTTDRADHVTFTCESCVNRGSGACVVFASPTGKSTGSVCYDWSGAFANIE